MNTPLSLLLLIFSLVAVADIIQIEKNLCTLQEWPPVVRGELWPGITLQIIESSCYDRTDPNYIGASLDIKLVGSSTYPQNDGLSTFRPIYDQVIVAAETFFDFKSGVDAVAFGYDTDNYLTDKTVYITFSFLNQKAVDIICSLTN